MQADESSSGNADLAARLNAIFAAEAPINPTFVLTDGLMVSAQSAPCHSNLLGSKALIYR